MKKFLFLLILLILIGGTVFVLGWVQILLPAESHAVIFTKTGGYDDRVVEPGTFCWRWERLIPGNLVLHVFRLVPVAYEKTIEGVLPSAELYASLLPQRPDFSYEAVISLQAHLDPASLPRLVRDRGLKADDLADWSRREAEQAMQWALKSWEDDIPENLPDDRLVETLRQRFPDLKIVDARIHFRRGPDLKLYSLAREAYFGLLREMESSRQETAEKLAAEQARNLLESRKVASSLKVLEQYGELFNRYPVLLKMLYLKAVAGQGSPLPEISFPAILEEPK